MPVVMGGERKRREGEERNVEKEAKNQNKLLAHEVPFTNSVTLSKKLQPGLFFQKFRERSRKIYHFYCLIWKNIIKISV